MSLKKPYRTITNPGKAKQLYANLKWSKLVPPEKLNELESNVILWLIVFVMIVGGIMYIVADDDSLLRSFDGQDIYKVR